MSSNRDVGSAMFRDKVEIPDNRQLVPKPPATQQNGDQLGKKCKLITNCFSISMAPTGSIYHYTVSMVPAAKSLKEEEWVMQSIWDTLSKAFNGVFIVRTPGHVFTPNTNKHAANMQCAVAAENGYEAHEVSVNFLESISADQVNSGKLGIAGVVMQHVVKRLSGQLMYQKVGRRYYDCSNTTEGKAQLMIFSSFYAGLQALNSCGPLMQIDTLHRAAHKRNMIEYMTSALERDPMQLDDVEVQAEWRRRCTGATVVTLYNNKIYRIKEIDFSMNPTSSFKHFRREDQTEHDFTLQKYYQAYYQKEITELRQPLLVAYPEKDSEKVHLVPELCALTGFNDDMRKDKNLMSEALKQTKVAAPERLKGIVDLAQSMGKAGTKTEDDQPQRAAVNQLMQDWKLTLNKEPVEVEARVHEPLEVSFGTKRYPCEEGSFQRWMRNGLQCPTRLDDWLFIYPESDVPVLDIWLRSLRDIAQVAFAMKMADPQRVICTEQRREIVQLLENRLTPKTQMVLLLTPQKDAKKVYELFKQTTISRYPCVTQVVKSETIRKRQSIAAVLSRIVLQINAKFCGPLWHIDLEVPVTAPLMTVPTMTIGLDVYQSFEGGNVQTYIGFAASLDTRCAEYYSFASLLDKQDVRGSMSEKIQEFLREAILQFTRRNSKMLPEHFIIYRASASEDQWSAIRQTEIEAVKHFFSSLNQLDVVGQKYDPKLTFVAISKHTHMRFFAHSEATAAKAGSEGKPGTPAAPASFKNPEPGSIIDVKETSRPDAINFYLVNQAAGKGTANPTHYTILYDTASVSPVALQSLTYRLSYLYFNFTGSVKMPAPAQYAKKIAHMIGTAVRTDPHKRLLCSFFYL